MDKDPTKTITSQIELEIALFFKLKLIKLYSSYKNQFDYIQR